MSRTVAYVIVTSIALTVIVGLVGVVGVVIGFVDLPGASPSPPDAGLAFTTTSPDDKGGDPGSDPVSKITALPEAAPDPRPDPDGFLAAWDRALTVEFSLWGGVEVTTQGVVGEAKTRHYGVRRARLEGRELDQTSTAAIITASGGEGVTMTACEQATDGRFLCTGSEPGLTTGERLARVAETVEPGGGYEVVPVPSPAENPAEECWRAERRQGGEPNGWNDQTVFCFDADTGVLVYQETTGIDRSEVFRATDVTTDVTDDHLDPVPYLQPASD